jgi:hypothetical protein
MPPSSKAAQLVRDLEIGAGAPQMTNLPGHPSIGLSETAYMRQPLEKKWDSQVPAQALTLYIDNGSKVAKLSSLKSLDCI